MNKLNITPAAITDLLALPQTLEVKMTVHPAVSSERHVRERLGRYMGDELAKTLRVKVATRKPGQNHDPLFYGGPSYELEYTMAMIPMTRDSLKELLVRAYQAGIDSRN